MKSLWQIWIWFPTALDSTITENIRTITPHFLLWQETIQTSVDKWFLNLFTVLKYNTYSILHCTSLLELITLIIIIVPLRFFFFQLMMAFVISALYCLVMMAVLIGIIIQMLEDGILSPASLFFLAVALQIVIAGNKWTNQHFALCYDSLLHSGAAYIV